MVGAFAVGKTSLVRQFVESIFDETYQTTVGVKIDRKSVSVDGEEALMLLWDIQGEDEVTHIPESYLRGAAGCVFVVDGTRPETLAVAHECAERVHALLGPIPSILLLNKNDLANAWRLDPDEEAAVGENWDKFRASAKTGEGVEDAFARLAERLISQS